MSGPPSTSPVDAAAIGGLRRRTADGTTTMVAGALVGALGAYAFQLVGGRVLGSEEFAPIAVLWTVQFLVFTIVLIPVEQLTIRRLAVFPDHPLSQDLPLLSGTVLVTAAAVTGALLVWRDQILEGEVIHALQGGLIVVGYGILAFGRGRLAGMTDYRSYGIATGSESVFRLVLAIPILALAASSSALAWSMVAAPLVIFFWRPFRRVRAGGEAVQAPGAGGFLANFVLANGASNVILAAGPLVVSALGAPPEMVSAFFVRLILLRAPFTLAYGLVARILSPMSRLVAEGRDERLHVWARRILIAGLGVSLAGGLVGRWLGPWIVQLMFGAEFRPTPTVASLIVAGVGAALASLAVTQLLVARGQTGRLAAAWLTALAAAAVAIVVSSGLPDVRVGIGFLVGQAVALAGIASAVLVD